MSCCSARPTITPLPVVPSSSPVPLWIPIGNVVQAQCIGEE